MTDVEKIQETITKALNEAGYQAVVIVHLKDRTKFEFLGEASLK